MTHEETLELWKDVIKLSRHPSRKIIMSSGAVFLDPDRVYISKEAVTIGKNTVVATEVYLLGYITIGEECIIGPGQVLCNVSVKNRVQIGARPDIHDSLLADNVRIGRLAEIVRSAIEDGAAIQHFSYVGDTDVGAGANIGAGSVVANFNGFEKTRTRIGRNAFVGSSTTIVAPVTIGEESFIGAGAVVRKNIKPNTVVVGLDRVLPDRECVKQGKNWNITKTKTKPLFDGMFGVTVNDVPF